MSSRLLNKDNDFLNFSVKVDGKLVKFNILTEVRINEDDLTHELLEQPKVYAFALGLRARLLKEKQSAELEVEVSYGKAYKRLKNKNNPKTNRAWTNDDAKVLAELDKDYLEAKGKVITYTSHYNKVDALCKALEQRVSVMQTVSANKRKERE